MNLDLMKDFVGNLDFGPIKGNQFKLAMNGGIAIRKINDTNEQWIVYDKETKSITNVGSLSFKASGMLWKMPVNQVVAGDLIIHEGQPCYVQEVLDNGNRVQVYGVNENRDFTFSPVKNVFNFPTFYTKVTNVMDGTNPFSNPTQGQTQINGMNFNPMMMAMMDGDFDMKDIMKLQMLNGMGGNGFNPMAMMFLNKMEDKDPFSKSSGSTMESLMEMMMMQNMMGNGNSMNPFGNLFGQAPAANTQTATPAPASREPQTPTPTNGSAE